MEAIKINLYDSILDLKYDLSKDVVLISFNTNEKLYKLNLNKILYFSFSNPNEDTFPLWADSDFKIISAVSCRDILSKKAFGFDGFDIPEELFYLRSEGAIMLEIIAKTAMAVQ